jgi:hypothetical protein
MARFLPRLANTENSSLSVRRQRKSESKYLPGYSQCCPVAAHRVQIGPVSVVCQAQSLCSNPAFMQLPLCYPRTLTTLGFRRPTVRTTANLWLRQYLPTRSLGEALGPLRTELAAGNWLVDARGDLP